MISALVERIAENIVALLIHWPQETRGGPKFLQLMSVMPLIGMGETNSAFESRVALHE